jgi:hypothetical protein
MPSVTDFAGPVPAPAREWRVGSMGRLTSHFPVRASLDRSAREPIRFAAACSRRERACMVRFRD